MRALKCKMLGTELAMHTIYLHVLHVGIHIVQYKRFCVDDHLPNGRLGLAKVKNKL